MDSMLKRVKVLTETLSSLRRYSSPSLQIKYFCFKINVNICFFSSNSHRHLTESTPSAKSAQERPLKVLDQGPPNSQNLCSSLKLQPRYSVRTPLPTPYLPTSQIKDRFMEAHGMKSTAASEVQHLHNFPLTHEQDSPTVAKVPQSDLRFVNVLHLVLLAKMHNFTIYFCLHLV